VVSWTESLIIAILPDEAISGPVVVTVNGQPSNANFIFAVRSALQPKISSLFPASGPSGTSLIVSGSGFGKSQGTGTITFGGTPAKVISWTGARVIAEVPEGAATGPIVVNLEGVASHSDPIFTATSLSSFSLGAITLTPEHPTLHVGETEAFIPSGIFRDKTIQRLNSATIAAGIGHTCVVLSNGTVRCWGDNTYGQLGNGSTLPSPVPAEVHGIRNAATITAGNAHTCALLSEGRMKCWGENSLGQLGNGSNIGSSIPVEVAGVAGVIAISARGNHTCSVLSDAAVRCWGADSRLGDEHTADPISGMDGEANPSSAVAGETHACALVSGGRVRCWGDNKFGQLGTGNTAPSATPVEINGLSHAEAIAAGSYHTCVVLSNGTVQCWGGNLSGQLGNGKVIESTQPVIVSGITTAAAVVWTSSDPAVATVDENGRTTGRRPGLATISATSRGVSGSTTLLVEPPALPPTTGIPNAVARSEEESKVATRGSDPVSLHP
jgi:hypothetical protein